MTAKGSSRILHSSSPEEFGNVECPLPVFRRPEQTVLFSQPRGITDVVLSITSRRSGVGSRRREERGVSVGLDDAFRVDTTQERIHPGPVERGRTPVIRGAGGEWPQRLQSKTKSTTRPQWLFSRRLSMKLSIFLPRANAVPAQDVLAAGWQPGTFCSTSWGRMATAKRLGAGVRNVKEGGALTVLVGLAAKFLLDASPSSFGHPHCHTADQTRERRGGWRERDGHNPYRPATGNKFSATMLSVLLAASWLAASTWKEGWIRCWSHFFPCGARLPLPLLPSPDVSTSSPSPPDLGKRGKGKVLSLARLPRRSEVAVAMIGPPWSRLTLFLRHRVISPELPSAGPGGLLLAGRPLLLLGSQEDQRTPPGGGKPAPSSPSSHTNSFLPAPIPLPSNFIQTTALRHPSICPIVLFIKMLASSRLTGAVARVAAQQPSRMLSTQGTWSMARRWLSPSSCSCCRERVI